MKREVTVPTAKRVACLCALFTAIAIGGCEKIARNMYDQPRYKPLAESPAWPDGRSSRAPVPETIAHSEGSVAGTSSGRAGQIQLKPDAPNPVAVIADNRAAGTTNLPSLTRKRWTLPVLERGQQRFNIYCAPCHSEAGDGDGMIARRGFPHPPSFHIDRLRKASDDYLYAVITNGYGDMYSYADRIPPDDRRAIVGYIRALQLSQNARIADVKPAARSELKEAQ